MHLTDLLRPVAPQLLADALRQSHLMPSPTDAARQVAPGPIADRVLVFGGGVACGLGVRTQELALPGRLAHALGHRTGRGAAVDVLARRSVLAADAPALLAQARLDHYDGLLVALGTADGYRLTPLPRWRAGLARLLDEVRERAAPGTVVVVAGTSPMPRTFDRHGPLLALWDAHAARMDAVTAELCAERTGLLFTPLGLPAQGRAQMGAGDYDTVAHAAAARMAPHLDALATARPAGSARERRDTEDPEPLRQEALERTGLLDRDREDDGRRLERLLRNARDLLGARAAAVTLLDGGSLRTKAVIGTEPFVVDRSRAVCDRTIRRDGAHVERDLTGQPIAESGWYFYAGFPIESPDGYRIGALCVLDDEPRPSDPIDEGLLQELAARVQNELWAEIDRDRPALHARGAA